MSVGAPGSRPRTWLHHVLPGAAELMQYRQSWLRPDLVAGLAVWAVLVPQGLAYGELAGLSPVTGLYTALGALLLYPLLGGSRYVHIGPESAVAIVTAAYIGGLVADAPERAESTRASPAASSWPTRVPGRRWRTSLPSGSRP